MSWHKNHEILHKRWPVVANALITTQDNPEIIFFDQGPEPTLIIQDLQLTSCYNRFKEALLHVRALPPNPDEIYFYGPGLGDAIRLSIEKHPKSKLWVMPLNLSLCKASMTHFNHLDWLTHPMVELSLNPPSNPIMKNFIVNPIELRLSDNKNIELRDKLTLAMLETHSKEKMLEREPTLMQHLKANKAILHSDGDVRQLFSTHEQGVSVVVGAGPTLNTQLHLLEKIRSKIKIICVSHALKPLLDAQIIPDIVIIIDPEKSVREHIHDLPTKALKQIPLVYLPSVDPLMLQAWPGPRFATYVEHKRYIETMRAHPKGVLFSSGTVIHSAIDLAVKMGSHKVILMGVDFALPAGQSHIQNAVNAEVTKTAANYTLEDGHGQRVATSIGFILYLRDLENYIKQHPEISFINTGRDGAFIKGTQWLETKDD